MAKVTRKINYDAFTAKAVRAARKAGTTEILRAKSIHAANRMFAKEGHYPNKENHQIALNIAKAIAYSNW